MSFHEPELAVLVVHAIEQANAAGATIVDALKRGVNKLEARYLATQYHCEVARADALMAQLADAMNSRDVSPERIADQLRRAMNRHENGVGVTSSLAPIPSHETSEAT